MWLLVQNRIQTVDILGRKNWPHSPTCVLCDQEPETAANICLGCEFAREVWARVAVWTACSDLRPPVHGEAIITSAWWEQTIAKATQSKQERSST